MENRSLPNLIKDIVMHYVKYYYEKYLKDNSISFIEENALIQLVDNIYKEKQTELRAYIRKTLKENQKENYQTLAVENILMDMFNDERYAKERIIVEILAYQSK